MRVCDSILIYSLYLVCQDPFLNLLLLPVRADELNYNGEAKAKHYKKKE